MKNLKRTAVLSIFAIVFTLGITSCGKHNVKRDMDGTWNIVSVTQNGVDMWTQMGASVSGAWTFDKKEKKCTVSTTISSPSGTQTDTGEMSYKVKDKETVELDGELFNIQELTDQSLILTFSEGGDVISYNFNK